MVIVITGPIASGKSTVARALARELERVDVHSAVIDLDQHSDADPVYVTLQVSFEEALRRAQGDPTRGISRDPGFLASYFAAKGQVLEDVPATDFVIDTERVTATSAAATIAGLTRRALD